MALKKIRYQLLFAIVILATGCELFEAEGNQDQRIVVENDAAVLSSRISYPMTALTIDPLSALSKSSVDEDTIYLTLVAEVDPPTIGGITLQATDIKIKGNKAYVSYNMQGAEFAGAVEIFDISDGDSPELISSVTFDDTDVNGVAISGNNLYLAAARDNADLTTPAILEIIKLKGGRLTDDTEIIDLPSFAGTDVDVANKYIYVTSGDAGGAVTILKANDLTLHNQIDIEDARGVDTDKHNVAVIAGTPARLVTFNRGGGTLEFDYTLTGATIPFSKSTVEIKDGKAFLGVGDGGTQIVCLSDGTVLREITQPVVSGLAADVTVTNAVTVYKRTMFMANGEAGVYVALAPGNFDKKGCIVDTLNMIGSIRFDDLQSVNHILYRHDLLFVATGLGGLKIVRVATNKDEPDDDDEDEDD